MKLTLDYQDLNRIVQLYVCKDLGLSPLTDIEISVPSEEYDQNLEVSLSVYHKDDAIDEC